MDDISSTTSIFIDRSLEAALDGIAEAGFPQAEIFVLDPHVGAPTEQELSRLRGILEAHSVRGRSMHAPGRRSTLAAMDDAWREESVGILAGYVRMAGVLGMTELVIHPISIRDLAPYADDPALAQLMREAVQRSIDDLMPVIEESEVRITLENLPFPKLPLNSMKELRPVIDPYPSEAVGLIIDIGHAARLDLDPVDELHAAGDRLCGTHLHGVNWETGRDHFTPTLGGLDWDAMRQAFAEIGYTGPWTSEVEKPSDGQSLDELAREANEWMTSWLR
jgi:sugar phosphate isomerase/epimerase